MSPAMARSELEETFKDALQAEENDPRNLEVQKVTKSNIKGKFMEKSK